MSIINLIKEISDILITNSKENTMYKGHNNNTYYPQLQENTMHNTRNSNVPHANAYARQNRHDGGSGEFITINGRRIPHNGQLSGREICQEAGHSSGRRVVKMNGTSAQTIEPHKTYGAHELTDKYGRPVKITTMPDRTKGSGFWGSFLGNSRGSNALFGGRRSAASKACVTEQVYDVAKNFAKGGLDFDENNADWVVFPNFFLPSNWNQRTSPLMIVFPTDYPAVPPIGFYLPENVVSPHGHKYGQAYHSAYNAPTQEGWDWYCYTVNPGAWKPAAPHARSGWRSGDNLWQYITLINEVLGSDGD